MEEHLLRRNVKRFRGGLVFKAHRLVSPNSRLESNKEEEAEMERSCYLSTRCILGDIRLWVGDPSTSPCLVSLLRHPTLSLSRVCSKRFLMICFCFRN